MNNLSQNKIPFINNQIIPKRHTDNLSLFENKQLDALLDQLCDSNINPVLVVSTDNSPMIFKASNSCSLLFSRLLSDIVAFPLLDLFSEDISKEIKALLRRCKRSAHSQDIIIKLQLPEHPVKHISIIASIISVGTSQFFFIQFEDKTKEVSDQFEIQKISDLLQEKSKKDELTGLFTKQFYEYIFSDLIEKANNENSPLCLGLIDIDHFKEYNDKNGHEQGNLALTQLADILKKHLPENAIVCRIGGEEFAVIFTNSQLNNAYRLSQEVHRSIYEYPFKNKQNQPLHTFSVSLGLTSLRPEDTNWHIIHQRALSFISIAKQRGRNTIIWEPLINMESKE